MRTFHPMPIDEDDTQRVHATVPKEVYRRFRNFMPEHGSIQYAIRLIMEMLPEMITRDEAYKQVFLAEMREMYENDRRSQEGKLRHPIDPRQLIMLDIPNPEEIK